MVFAFGCAFDAVRDGPEVVGGGRFETGDPLAGDGFGRARADVRFGRFVAGAVGVGGFWCVARGGDVPEAVVGIHPPRVDRGVEDSRGLGHARCGLLRDHGWSFCGRQPWRGGEREAADEQGKRQ